jgi:hypothetical protein
MEKLKTILALLTLLTSLNFNAQIVVGGEEEKPKKEEKAVVEQLNTVNTREVEGTTQLYFNFNRSKTFRTLLENGPIYGKPLGERENEVALGLWSMGVGFRSELKYGLQFGAGIGYMTNGEQYSYEEPDTSFKYQSKYRYITMPLMLNYHCGNLIQFVSGVGVIPGMFMNFTQDQQSVTRQNLQSKETIKEKGGSQSYNAFIFSGFINAGVQLKYSKFWSLYIVPEYRIQLNNSFQKNQPFIHKANAFGVNFGLVYQL